ncbi:GlcG/HbpS family heme-binding protein [Pseudomonas typographi]|uniref:Heme-binding protein n=1 Tax=Pseudomonas typographi TaxID=2715964 RepID=A0ABR7Z9X0_9PSED|nr:heme-binding protein [Pseudomonas typographi]MBD1551103.1 heme-binding protein [Pseudomonas typographi]MBD1586403.1 heme-binding protein [Pseudomonas typographi]MBD1602220.1 heme-binding protein [Pseudomonas typographi]
MPLAALMFTALAPTLAFAQAPAAAVAPVVAQANVSTAAALQLAERATQLAAARNMKICIAVTDADGHLLAFTRMQGAYAGCVEASIAKATSAARFAINTITFYDLARKENLAIGTIPGILPAVGGVVLKHDGAVVGSVGISGDTDLTEQKLAEDLSATFP